MSKPATALLLTALFTASAAATFELEDPAAEFQKKRQAEAKNALGKVFCVDFLRHGADESDEYLLELRWVNLRVARDSDAPPIEPDLRAFCIDHPKHNLDQAAVALGAPPLEAGSD